MKSKLLKAFWVLVIAVALGRALVLAAVDLALRALGPHRVKFPKIRRVYANDSTDAVDVSQMPEWPRDHMVRS